MLGFQQLWENQKNHFFKISSRCNLLLYEMLYVKIEALLLVEVLYTNIPPETMEPHGTLVPTTAIFRILPYVRRQKCSDCYNFLYIIYIKYGWYCVKISGQKSQSYPFYEWKTSNIKIAINSLKMDETFWKLFCSCIAQIYIKEKNFKI